MKMTDRTFKDDAGEGGRELEGEKTEPEDHPGVQGSSRHSIGRYISDEDAPKRDTFRQGTSILDCKETEKKRRGRRHRSLHGACSRAFSSPPLILHISLLLWEEPAFRAFSKLARRGRKLSDDRDEDADRFRIMNIVPHYIYTQPVLSKIWQAYYHQTDMRWKVRAW